MNHTQIKARALKSPRVQQYLDNLNGASAAEQEKLKQAEIARIDAVASYINEHNLSFSEKQIVDLLVDKTADDIPEMLKVILVRNIGIYFVAAFIYGYIRQFYQFSIIEALALWCVIPMVLGYFDLDSPKMSHTIGALLTGQFLGLAAYYLMFVV